MKKLIALLLPLFASCISHAQGCPPVTSLYMEQATCGNQPVYLTGWPAGAHVAVYYTSGLSTAQQVAMRAELNNWTSRLAASGGSPPTFGPFIEEFTPALPTNLPTPYIGFQKGSTTKCGANQTACTITYPACNPLSGRVSYAVVTLGTTITDPGYQIFAHEIGHSFGEFDCAVGAQGCSPAVTVMYKEWSYNSAMSPHCCDSKLLYKNDGGLYGQPGPSCSPIVVQGTNMNPGTAYLEPLSDDNTTVMATFPMPPQSGDAIVVGCESFNYAPPPGTAADNQGNSYLPVEAGTFPLATQLYVAPDVAASQSQPFTVQCTVNTDDVGTSVNLFALRLPTLAAPRRRTQHT